MNKDYLAGADGIRGLACLIVISLHSIGLFFSDIQFYTLGMDKLGVWIFFVLSSFLLTRQFLKNGFSSGVIIDYSISRALRIIPAVARRVNCESGSRNLVNITMKYFIKLRDPGF
ncbi:Acyltransferase family [Yersinia frederiksenii]|nr:Acyltransferase family [Yersinia frederiksenii]